MTSVLSSEWLKLRSVRSTYAIGAVVVLGVLLNIAIALQVAAMWDHMIPLSRRGDYALRLVQGLMVPVMQLSVAILGVLTITSEYAKGTIQGTFLAVPRRGMVLGGKALVLAATAAVVGTLSVAVAFAASHAILDGLPVLPDSTPPFSDQVALMIACGLSGVLFALVGLGIGTVLRSTPPAIVVMVALWYLLPLATQWLPTPWDARVASLWLPNLPPQVVDQEVVNFGLPGVLPPWGAAAVAIGYVVLALGAAAAVLRRRDV